MRTRAERSSASCASSASASDSAKRRLVGAGASVRSPRAAAASVRYSTAWIHMPGRAGPIGVFQRSWNSAAVAPISTTRPATAAVGKRRSSTSRNDSFGIGGAARRKSMACVSPFDSGSATPTSWSATAGSDGIRSPPSSLAPRAWRTTPSESSGTTTWPGRAPACVKARAGQLTTSSSPTPSTCCRWRSAASATFPCAAMAAANAASSAGSRGVERSMSKATASAPASNSACVTSA